MLRADKRASYCSGINEEKVVRCSMCFYAVRAHAENVHTDTNSDEPAV